MLDIALLLQPARHSTVRGDSRAQDAVLKVFTDKIGEALPPVLQDMDEFVCEKRKASRIHLAARVQGPIPVRVTPEIDVFAKGDRALAREVTVLMDHDRLE